MTVDGPLVADGKNTYNAGQSIYNNPAGKGIRSGSLGAGGQYDLAGSGYSRVHTGSNSGGTATEWALNEFVLGNSRCTVVVLLPCGLVLVQPVLMVDSFSLTHRSLSLIDE